LLIGFVANCCSGFHPLNQSTFLLPAVGQEGVTRSRATVVLNQKATLKDHIIETIIDGFGDNSVWGNSIG
tara:strand:+ start:417 stop:626 length:210 start_codon:yes stop_codon:yes gene_type:complete